MKWLVGCVSVLVSIQSVAENDRPYYFSGPCTSQGSWTQAALQATQKIREIATQLRDDPNCKTLGQSLQSKFSAMQAQLESANSQGDMSRAAQLPAEIQALRQFVIGSPNMKGTAMNLMMSKAVQGATLAASVDSASILGSSNLGAPLLSLGKRVKAASDNGVQLMNQVLQSLPDVQQCLVAPDTMGQMIAGSISVLSAFAASGQSDTGLGIANAVSQIAKYRRDKKFADVFRRLNETEFLSSMACLVELTSESYCTARDAHNLFEKGMKELKVSSNEAGFLQANGRTDSKRTIDNPLNGYYVLTQHVSNVTKWLQKIQIGVDPKIKTDATFQSNILLETISFITTMKKVKGLYNQKVDSIRALPSDDAQKNAVYELIVEITTALTASEGENFFTKTVNSLNMPFYLVGIETPAVVSGKITPTIGYDQWFMSHMDAPIFKDPMALAGKIGTNLDKIFDSANTSAIQYYGKWFLVDQPVLANESVTSATYSVKDSLIAISNYLDVVYDHVITYHADRTAIGEIIQTQDRIRQVLVLYKNIDDLSSELVKFRLKNRGKLIPPELNAKIAKSYSDLINGVYQQFNVMLSRSGFISTRLANLVYLDYSILLKNHVDFSRYQEEFFYASGQNAINQMMEMFSGNPASIPQDLSLASKINKSNIEALEILLKDSMLANIALLRLISEKGKVTDSDVAKESWLRSIKDVYTWQIDELKSSKNPLYRIWWTIDNQVRTATLPFWLPILHYQYSDRYPMPGIPFVAGSTVYSPDDEFHSAKALYSQLCIQALAFNGWREFKTLCQDVELKSPFPRPTNLKDAAKFDDYLSVSFMKKAIQNKDDEGLNHSERICAFRDFNRRNLVMYLTLGETQAQNQGSTVLKH